MALALILADGVILDAKLWFKEFCYSIKLLSDSVWLEKLVLTLKVKLLHP